jgi:CRISPR-associated endoribonuclease Cas6
LIGRSIDYLPYFIYTFDELGRIGIGKGKGRYSLESVDQREMVKGERQETKKDQMSAVIYSGKDKILKNNFRILNIDDLASFNLSPLTLHLKFLTPTRLKFDGRLSPKLEFHILIRNLIRRISLLSYFHCGEELVLDFRGLIEKAKGVKVQKENLQWCDWERYSNRQGTKMKMGGFVGSVIFEGVIKELIPFLLVGEYIHVGKGTSFGLGKYEIEF